MKKNVLAVALALMASIGAYAEKNTVSSPDGKLNVVVEDRMVNSIIPSTMQASG